jgi:hypothetical protein
VTIRLDPKLRYLTELASRKQRRTVSSFIEWAIEQALDKIVLREEFYGIDSESRVEISLGREAEKLWDPDESDRVMKLGLEYPDLLTYEEQLLWKLVRETGYFWRGHFNSNGYWTWETDLESLSFQRVREYWDILKQVADGEANRNQLPQTPRKESQDSKDDDITLPSHDDTPF